MVDFKGETVEAIRVRVPPQPRSENLAPQRTPPSENPGGTAPPLQHQRIQIARQHMSDGHRRRSGMNDDIPF
jgi:hypothetical protein